MGLGLRWKWEEDVGGDVADFTRRLCDGVCGGVVDADFAGMGVTRRLSSR